MIHEIFGVIGFEWNLTLRELIQAHEGHEKSAWSRTSLIAAILANSSRDPKQRRKPFVPDDFNPYADKAPSHDGTRLNTLTLSLFATAVSSITGK